jgi:hypothetical protein
MSHRKTLVVVLLFVLDEFFHGSNTDGEPDCRPDSRA